MLTAFDKKLLNVLQAGLPISSRPFADLAQGLESDEKTVLSRVKELKAQGYLRRIGPFFDSAKMGYRGTLVALRVKPEAMKSVAEAVNRHVGVTHNYEREVQPLVHAAHTERGNAPQDSRGDSSASRGRGSVESCLA